MHLLCWLCDWRWIFVFNKALALQKALRAAVKKLVLPFTPAGAMLTEWRNSSDTHGWPMRPVHPQNRRCQWRAERAIPATSSQAGRDFRASDGHQSCAGGQRFCYCTLWPKQITFQLEARRTCACSCPARLAAFRKTSRNTIGELRNVAVQSVEQPVRSAGGHRQTELARSNSPSPTQRALTLGHRKVLMRWLYSRNTGTPSRANRSRALGRLILAALQTRPQLGQGDQRACSCSSAPSAADDRAARL
ncbi:MAG: hypothetical protein U1E47_00355 [Rivihabitans pingtungensis]